ncbi:MAG: hypothetical protein V8S89_01015, partial [Oscillospiraceae bacterium]
MPLEAGAFVIVPVGRYGAEKLGRVTGVSDCTEQDAPYPPERTKFVLRRAAETAFPQRNVPPKRVPQRDALQENAPQETQSNAPPGPAEEPAASGRDALGAVAQAAPEEAPQLDRAQAAKPRDLPGVILDTLPGPILDTLPQPIRLKSLRGKRVHPACRRLRRGQWRRKHPDRRRTRGKKAAVPNGAGTPKRWRRWLLLAATLGAFLFVLLRPAPEPKHAEDHELFARWEAEWEAEQQAKKAEIQAMRDAGLPYVGMPESEIGTTPVLG